MRDILPDVERWIQQHKPIAIASVVETWGSSPRGVGARMAFTADGEIAGSVSGGCVESAVIEAGSEVLRGGPPRLLHFSVADETAWSVGLTCGGSLDVFVSRLDETLIPSLRDALADAHPTAMITVIRGPDEFLGRALLMATNGQIAGSLGTNLDLQAAALVGEDLHSGRPGRLALADGIEVFRDVLQPLPTLVIVGGVHVAIALTKIARALGWKTVMIDPRKIWANAQRFADVDQLLQVWPQEAFNQAPLAHSAAVVTLTHDPKIDDAALTIALRSPAFYVGALGSARSHEKRRARLVEVGLGDVELSRLHAPVGMKIEAQTPEEIALSIMAEIISEYRGRSSHAQERRAPRAESARSTHAVPS